MITHPTLLAVLRTLSAPLPARGELTTEAWLAECRGVLPRDQWVRLATVALSLEARS